MELHCQGSLWLTHRVGAAAVSNCYVYTYCIYLGSEDVVSKTRIFKSGNSQAVRLPKQFRFHVDQVEILRRGDEIVLREPKRNLGQAFVMLGTMPEDFMAEGRREDAAQKRDAI